MGNEIKVLLVSPYKGTVGGISQRTGHVMEFYKRKGHDDVHLEQFYGKNEKKHIVHGGDSVVKRLILGIGSYLPLVKEVKTKLKTVSYDILHICSSGSYGLVRDCILLKKLICSVLSLPSYSEGFPNVFFEGMACGCSIVATPVGTLPEMIVIDGGNTCGVLPSWDVDALRVAIADLINNPTKAKTLGDNASKRVNEVYSLPKV